MGPDAAIAKLVVDLGVNAAIGGVRGRLLQARRPAPAEIYGGSPIGAAAPNLILVIGESVALSRTGPYGYVRQTTPRLAAVRDARPDDWVQLERAVANASATKVALPALLSGLFPSRESVEQHTFPLLYHYVKAAGYKTALITSQSYAWNKLQGFFLDAGLDHAFTLERSDAEIVNSEGMDDRRMLAEGLATIDRFAQEGPFVVVLQFNCTHYPGYSPPEVQVWDQSGGDRDARYDNSIVYMDRLLGMLFEHLDETGLADNTSVVFAADHGEDLGAVHKLHRTDSYYQTTIAVPVFFVIPERQRQRLGAGFARLRSNAGVRTALTDLVPTTLDLLGLSYDMVINIGARYDQFDPESVYPSDRRNPANQLILPDSMTSKYPQAPTIEQISPRLGFAYQLGNQAVLHFSSGHFFQMPPMYAMYQNHSFLVDPNFLNLYVSNFERMDLLLQYHCDQPLKKCMRSERSNISFKEHFYHFAHDYNIYIHIHIF